MSFRELHQGDRPLVLPNAWDVPSALMLLDAGFPAIGTTSFGVAVSSGTPDGNRSTKDINLRLARALVTLPVPISMDVEDAYTDDPDEAADYVARLGVAGINIEDSKDAHLIEPSAHAAKIAAIKRRCPEVFVNARVDNYWFGQDAEPDAVLARARRYVEAGADGVFVPGATEPEVLRTIAAGVHVPLNVLAQPSLTVAELGALGVRRISTGSLPYRAALRAAVDAACAVRDGSAPPAAIPYWDLQERIKS